MLNDSTDTTLDITREDIEKTLDANGYFRGKPDEDPDKDATHIWYSSDNRRYVKFSIPEDNGQVLYGDVVEGDAYITYNNALLVLTGLMTLAEAKKPKFVLPGSVAAKLAAARAASAAAALPAPEAGLALPEQGAQDVPEVPHPSGDPIDKGVFETPKGDKGVFETPKGDKGVF